MNRSTPDGYCRIVSHPEAGCFVEDVWLADTNAVIDTTELAAELGPQLEEADALSLVFFRHIPGGQEVTEQTVLEKDYKNWWMDYIAGISVYASVPHIRREVSHWESFYKEPYPVRGDLSELVG